MYSRDVSKGLGIFGRSARAGIDGEGFVRRLRRQTWQWVARWLGHAGLKSQARPLQEAWLPPTSFKRTGVNPRCPDLDYIGA